MPTRRRKLMWSVPTFYSSGQFGTSGESEPSTSSEEDRHRTQQQQQQQQQPQQQPPLLQQQLQVRQLDANQLPQQRVIELQQFQPIRLDEDSNDQRSFFLSVLPSTLFSFFLLPSSIYISRGILLSFHPFSLPST